MRQHHPPAILARIDARGSAPAGQEWARLARFSSAVPPPAASPRVGPAMPDRDCLFIRLGDYFAERRSLPHQEAALSSAEERSLPGTGGHRPEGGAQAATFGVPGPAGIGGGWRGGTGGG